MKSAELDVETLRLMYEQAAAARITEVELNWSRFTALSTLQTAALAAYAIGADELNRPSHAILPLLGLCFSVAWLAIARRGAYWAKYWLQHAAEIERLLGANRLASVFAYADEGPSKYHLLMRFPFRLRQPPTSSWVASIPVAFGACWLAILFIELRWTFLWF
jgi:hypothetical protein